MSRTLGKTSKQTSSRTGKPAKTAKTSKTKATSQRKAKTPKAPLATREMAAVTGHDEPVSQVTLKLRQSQHRQLAQMAFDAGTTMRGIIMRALKAKGLTVTKDDLKDRRRR